MNLSSPVFAVGMGTLKSVTMPHTFVSVPTRTFLSKMSWMDLKSLGRERATSPSRGEPWAELAAQGILTPLWYFRKPR